MDAYRDAKLRIFRAQGPDDLAILPPPLAATGRAPGRRLYDGAPGPDAAAWARDGLHVASLGRVAGWDDIPLRGRHNRENAMAAAALAAHAGVGAVALAEGFATFSAVPPSHEPVGERDGVAYVNDTKATNPEREALAALKPSFEAMAEFDLDGKGTSFAPLAAACRGPVVHAYLIGEAGPEMAEAFAGAGVAHTVLTTLDRAVTAAAAAARPGEVVLLAPACTSWDAYSSYEERGDAFRAAVAALGARPPGA